MSEESPLTNSAAKASDDGAHGAGLAILGDPHRTRSDIRMVARAIREGWDVAPENRPKVVNRLLDIVDKTETTVMTKQGPVALDGPADTNSIMAANVLLGMTKHNLGDIHHQEKQGNDDERLKNERASVLLKSMTDQDWIDMARGAGKVDRLPPRLKELALKQDAGES